MQTTHGGNAIKPRGAWRGKRAPPHRIVAERCWPGATAPSAKQESCANCCGHEGKTHAGRHRRRHGAKRKGAGDTNYHPYKNVRRMVKEQRRLRPQTPKKPKTPATNHTRTPKTTSAPGPAPPEAAAQSRRRALPAWRFGVKRKTLMRHILFPIAATNASKDAKHIAPPTHKIRAHASNT